MNSLKSLNGIDLVSPEPYRHVFVWMMTQPPTDKEKALFGAEAADRVFQVRVMLAKMHARNTHDWTELVSVNNAGEARLLLGHILDFLSAVAAEEGADPIDPELWRKYFKVLLPFLAPEQESELNRFAELFRSEEWVVSDIWSTFLAVVPDVQFGPVVKAVKVQQQLGLLLRKLVWSADVASGMRGHYEAVRALIRPTLRGLATGKLKSFGEGVRMAQVLASLVLSLGLRVHDEHFPDSFNPDPSFWSRLRFYAARRSDVSWEEKDYVVLLAGALGRIPFTQYPFLPREVSKELILYDLTAADAQISEARSVKDAEERVDLWFPRESGLEQGEDDGRPE